MRPVIRRCTAPTSEYNPFAGSAQRLLTNVTDLRLDGSPTLGLALSSWTRVSWHQA